MANQLVVVFLVLVAGIPIGQSNQEGDILHAWRTVLSDPNAVLQSWDPTLVNPCTWFHVTCNADNSVIRVDLGNAGLSGPLVPQLGFLSNLQYLEVYNNSLRGYIPKEIGNLKRLISLDLFDNRFIGKIPASLGNLTSLRFMRLYNNKLRGSIPVEVLKLITRGDLQILDVSDNLLAGTVHNRKARVTTIKQDSKVQK